MLNNSYSNFVKASSTIESSSTVVQSSVSGEEARRIYLEEIKEAGNTFPSKIRSESRNQYINKNLKLGDISQNDLFICVQHNDVETLNHVLDTSPNLINTIDEYGWSLLMIGCQANAVDVVKELIKRGIDMHVRDKAGNSAQNLVIKNRNLVLVDMLLSRNSSEPEIVHKSTGNNKKPKSKESYLCEICNKEFLDKEEHLSSTVHNISASKDKKIPTKYIIPASNKGYQLMLKGGWDRESGLGPDGSGTKYPIKTVQKQDRKGLGLDRRKRKVQEEQIETVKHINKRRQDVEYKNSRNIEINFRRQFY